MEEGEKDGMRKSVFEGGSDKALESSANSKIVSELAENGLASDECGRSDKGDEVTEVKRNDAF